MGLARRDVLRLAATTGAAALGATAGGILLATPAFAFPAVYNPFAGYPISDGWQDHINRGSLGGIDFVMPVGTPLPACGAGVVTNIPENGTGGNTVTIDLGEGYRSQYMHLSQFLLANGTAVGPGAIVGLSGGAAGAPGSGSSTGPHCHWHMIDPSGTRIDPLAYIAAHPGSPAPTSGPMYHEIRAASGAWSGFQPLNGYLTTLPGNAKDMAIAGFADGSAQVAIIGADDCVYHRVRNANATWSSFQPVVGVGTTSAAKAKRISLAALPDGSAQLLMIGADGTVYHRVRNANGTWQDFTRVSGYQTTAPAGAKDVAICGMPDGSAQVLIVGMDDGIYHRVRGAGGSWSAFGPLNGNGTTATALGSAVAITGLPDGSSQTVIAGGGGALHHRIRYANGTWSAFQPVPGVGTTAPAVAQDVSIAGTADGAAQVVIIGADDAVYHRIRAANGTWSAFGTLPGNGTPTPAKGSRVSIAGMPGNVAQLVIVGR
ncbi:peptidoglycan DD-metalloendopeptidase family protein [Hamadaea tsunoensis]|uniref:peptidoglycan DD-metalloendopeptidase family protein n=1 Tax=Hamadaea tsunoensis TaxID=53368 RepID=UPI0004248A9C|nr:peptidoglycan DD-metalloendopeptidase family protein [Hamadaea tsunoensis]